MATINYFIDGANLTNYGVRISSSDGIVSRPKLKAPLSVKWETEHGENVDLNNKFYEPREITLECFLVADTNEDFIRNSNAFCQLFDAKGTRRISVNVDSTEPLVFEVYIMDGIEFKKQWRDGQVVGTFTLKLREPDPVKRVYKFDRKSDTDTLSMLIDYAGDKMFNIHYGDSTHLFDYDGTYTISKSYQKNGLYYVIIAGDIDTITSITTNATLVWSRL